MKNKINLKTKYLLISLLVVLFLCSTTFIVGAKNLSPKDKGWKLQWSDEFNGKELNEDVWTYDIGTGFSGWGNNELQSYTDRKKHSIHQNEYYGRRHHGTTPALPTSFCRY